MLMSGVAVDSRDGGSDMSGSYDSFEGIGGAPWTDEKDSLGGGRGVGTMKHPLLGLGGAESTTCSLLGLGGAGDPALSNVRPYAFFDGTVGYL